MRLLAILFPALGLTVPGIAAAAIQLDTIELPEGFEIHVYADGVDNARQMALGREGTLFVGSRRAGRVHAVVDSDGDYRADTVHLIADGLQMPSGVAFRDGSLYVAAISRVLRFDGIEASLENPPAPELVSDAFPDDEWHGWKFIDFGPDGMLYVPVGAPCNVCLRDGYAGIKRMRPDGGGLEDYVQGVRNTVGFDWDPVSGDLWFTDNGRDHLGDNRPPDELNHVTEQGQHFGFPFCHGGDIPDPEWGKRRDCDEFRPPAQKLGPHVAAIGMTFYTGEQFPTAYRGDVLIAEHGSWNRSEKIGYRVTRVTLNEAREPVAYAPFASGWLQGEQAWGRPADVLVLPDGSLLVSDDEADAIYRIHYAGES